MRDPPMTHDDEETKCCQQDPGYIVDDLAFVKNLEIFESQLYYNLQMRKRAINNWKKLKVLLIMLKLSGGRTNSQDKQSALKGVNNEKDEDEPGNANDEPD